METVIESMEMRDRVDGEIKDLKKEFLKELDQVSSSEKQEKEGDGQLRREGANERRRRRTGFKRAGEDFPPELL